MEQLYDEKVVREIPQTWKREDGEYDGVDIFYLRVRLFKTEAVASEGLRTSRWPLYFLLSEYESYEGDPDVSRVPIHRTTKKSYTTGPDSKRIRQAVALCDGFEGRRAYNSR